MRHALQALPLPSAPPTGVSGGTGSVIGGDMAHGSGPATTAEDRINQAAQALARQYAKDLLLNPTVAFGRPVVPPADSLAAQFARSLESSASSPATCSERLSALVLSVLSYLKGPIANALAGVEDAALSERMAHGSQGSSEHDVLTVRFFTSTASARFGDDLER